MAFWRNGRVAVRQRLAVVAQDGKSMYHDPALNPM